MRDNATSDEFYLSASVLALWLENDITDVTSVVVISAKSESYGRTSNEDIRKRTITGGQSWKTPTTSHSKTDSGIACHSKVARCKQQG